MNWRGKRILIISSEKWSPLWVTKHHYAYTLALNGAKVWFLNPPESKWLVSKPFANLTVVDYKSFRGINRYPKKIKDMLNSILLKRLLDFLDLDRFELVWSFDPYRFQNLKLFRADKTIYYQVDPHQTKDESLTINSADLALSISKFLAQRNFGRAKFEILGHSLASSLLKRVKSGTRGTAVKVGYCGNMRSQWLDYELMRKVILSFPDVQFHFMGPGFNDISDFPLGIPSSPNVQFHEPGTFQLNEFLSKMDVLVLFYKPVNGSYPINSHKILEYLSSGKTVLSAPILDYVDKDDLIIMAENYSDYISALRHILNNLSEYNSQNIAKHRMNYAASHTYEKKLEIIDKLLYKSHEY